MTDETDSPTTQATPAAVTSPPMLIAGDPPTPAPFPPAQRDGAGSATQVAPDRPELIVGGAFAAGFVIAMIIKRLGR